MKKEDIKFMVTEKDEKGNAVFLILKNRLTIFERKT